MGPGNSNNKFKNPGHHKSHTQEHLMSEERQSNGFIEISPSPRSSASDATEGQEQHPARNFRQRIRGLSSRSPIFYVLDFRLDGVLYAAYLLVIYLHLFFVGNNLMPADVSIP